MSPNSDMPEEVGGSVDVPSQARGHLRLKAPLACLGFVLAIGMVPATAVPTAGPYPFPTMETTLWLTSEAGEVDGAEGQVFLMQAAAPSGGSASDGVLIPLLEQLGLGSHQAPWYAPASWNATRETTTDIQVDLYFFLNVQATTRLHVQVDDLAPDGSLTTLGEQDKMVSLQNLLPHHITFLLPAGGSHLEKGHALRLLVSAEDIDVLTWMQFGSSSTPSSVTLTHRLLDTDYDGIPDDHDQCPTDPDCDNDGQVDGGEVVYNNTINGDTINGGPGPGANVTGNGTALTHYHYYLNGLTPPEPPSGSEELAEGKDNVELVGGGLMGLAGLLVSAGGLFGRHPL